MQTLTVVIKSARFDWEVRGWFSQISKQERGSSQIIFWFAVSKKEISSKQQTNQGWLFRPGKLLHSYVLAHKTSRHTCGSLSLMAWKCWVLSIIYKKQNHQTNVYGVPASVHNHLWSFCGGILKGLCGLRRCCTELSDYSTHPIIRCAASTVTWSQSYSYNIADRKLLLCWYDDKRVNFIHVIVISRYAKPICRNWIIARPSPISNEQKIRNSYHLADPFWHLFGPVSRMLNWFGWARYVTKSE